MIGLTSVALPVGANTTLDMTNAPSAPTITGPQAVSLGGAVTFGNSNTAQTAVVSAVVSGAGSLTKAGAGELDLTGVNTYLGGTRLNGGVVNINSDSSLGAAAGALTFAGGTLQLKLATPVSSARDISLAGNGTFDTNGNASTLSGIISGPGSFTKGGAGTLTLSPSAANTYTGGTIINSGTLSIGDDSYLGSGGAVTLNGGSLEATNTIISARTFTMSGTGTIDTQTFGVTLGGLVNGGGVLTKEGTGTLTLTGTSNSYGGIIVDKGILNVNSDEALGSSVTLNGTTLQTDTATPGSGAGITTAHPITLSGGGTIDTLGNSSTFSGVISGNGGLNVRGDDRQHREHPEHHGGFGPRRRVGRADPERSHAPGGRQHHLGARHSDQRGQQVRFERPRLDAFRRH
ncbi:MAG: autotransporter-associated beta strand repeat-containing protein [Elusimicrobia bacterium]|nr:autotransporter-associated beta strand repeat-containing protein [Elusimicrobiota bacterium]